MSKSTITAGDIRKLAAQIKDWPDARAVPINWHYENVDSKYIFLRYEQGSIETPKGDFTIVPGPGLHLWVSLVDNERDAERAGEELPVPLLELYENSNLIRVGVKEYTVSGDVAGIGDDLHVQLLDDGQVEIRLELRDTGSHVVFHGDAQDAAYWIETELAKEKP